MLHWLVEERFIRRLGVDESYASRRADLEASKDDDEEWDDETPIWASIAQSTEGVEIQPSNAAPHSRNQSTAFTEPSLGLPQSSRMLVADSSNSNDHDSMEYEATLMGERITQLYLDPLSASILRTGLRRVRRKVRKNGDVTDFGMMTCFINS